MARCGTHTIHEICRGNQKGSNWRMSKDTLLSLYRALIRPIIEYRMEIYFNCSDSTLKQIETIQHECLRIRAGALRSTPIDCLQHHCNEMPLKLGFINYAYIIEPTFLLLQTTPPHLLYLTVGRKDGQKTAQTSIILICKLRISLKAPRL